MNQSTGFNNTRTLELKLKALEDEAEEITTIKLMWMDLGVTDSYKLSFEQMIVSLPRDFTKDLLYQEMADLRTVTEILLVCL